MHGFVSPSAACAAHQKHAGIPVAMEVKQTSLGKEGKTTGMGRCSPALAYPHGKTTYVTENTTLLSSFNPLLR